MVLLKMLLITFFITLSQTQEVILEDLYAEEKYCKEGEPSHFDDGSLNEHAAASCSLRCAYRYFNMWDCFRMYISGTGFYKCKCLSYNLRYKEMAWRTYPTEFQSDYKKKRAV